MRYRLCDAEGQTSSPYEVMPTGAEGDEGAVLTGPSITQDVSFTIMAVRDNSPSILLETYLNQSSRSWLESTRVWAPLCARHDPEPSG